MYTRWRIDLLSSVFWYSTKLACPCDVDEGVCVCAAGTANQTVLESFSIQPYVNFDAIWYYADSKFAFVGLEIHDEENCKGSGVLYQKITDRNLRAVGGEGMYYVLEEHCVKRSCGMPAAYMSVDVRKMGFNILSKRWDGLSFLIHPETLWSVSVPLDVSNEVHTNPFSKKPELRSPLRNATNYLQDLLVPFILSYELILKNGKPELAVELAIGRNLLSVDIFQEIGK